VYSRHFIFFRNLRMGPIS